MGQAPLSEHRMSYPSPARLILAPAALHNQRVGLQVFLALFLLLAQTGLILHELEHQSTAPDAYCALCLAAQHLGDAVHTALPPGFSSPPALPPAQPAVPAARTALCAPFSARAPPVHS